MKIGTHAGRPRAGSVSATDAAKNFGRLVDRVREERATYIIERGGTPVARIGPVEQRPFTVGDFKALIGSAPRVDEEYLEAVEAAISRHNRPRVRRNPWGR
ncbi:MAG: type II toxin-antitoxin system Phd/YefM family antitoxin [Acidobacteria bacterium]|nr:type II toxin-antitoxin system Phd/YefM family antitoxin [Acidobacteriota bacterium]